MLTQHQSLLAVAVGFLIAGCGLSESPDRYSQLEAENAALKDLLESGLSETSNRISQLEADNQALRNSLGDWAYRGQNPNIAIVFSKFEWEKTRAPNALVRGNYKVQFRQNNSEFGVREYRLIARLKVVDELTSVRQSNFSITINVKDGMASKTGRHRSGSGTKVIDLEKSSPKLVLTG